MYRSSPAKPAMNAATSSRPCIESAASWSAAIHPSVRSSSAATSAAVSTNPTVRGVPAGGRSAGGQELDDGRGERGCDHLLGAGPHQERGVGCVVHVAALDQ